MDPILALKQTKLFTLLVDKEKKIGTNSLSSKVEEIVTMVSPLLQKIPENMPEFTLHDPTHSLKIIELMGQITPQQVLLNFNHVEVSLLILSAYLHDVGMTCDKKEKEDIIQNDPEFDILFKSSTDKFQKYEQYIANNNHRAATFIQDQIFTEYLRRSHVKRSREFIERNLSSGNLLLSYNSIPFYKLLTKICDGHGEPVKKIYDRNNWPSETLVGSYIINVQFLTLILRLADILDLDSERTPKVIYEFVNPEDPVSIIEWKKHRSIIGTSINEQKILFEAECSSPEVERALRQFIDWIELERKETMDLLKTYTPEESSKYFLLLNESVTKSRINSDKTYIYNDLQFNLDYQRIMSLLMGQKLYKDPITSLRELLQNSIDAIKVRQKIYEYKTEQIIPTIRIELTKDTLTITDNGIGMNEKIFQDFFLQIGKSYYSSSDFYSKFSEIDITSEFGIGILSVFMIASSFTIESRREPDDPLQPYAPINFTIPAAQSFLIQRVGNRTEIGTRISLKLKSNNPFEQNDLSTILNELLSFPPFPILIVTNGVESIYSQKQNPEILQLDYSNIEVKEFLTQYRIRELDWKEQFTHSLISINFDDDISDEQLRDIKGHLKIVNSNPSNYYSNFSGVLSHRSFSVGFPKTSEKSFNIKSTESIHSLFPKWLSYFSSLNFTGKACLSITPDRCDFTIDEKHKILAAKIEKKIISELEAHFNLFIEQNGIIEYQKYMDFLFAAGFFGFDLNEIRNDKKISSDAKNFLSKYITFPVLDAQGKIIRKEARELFQSETLALLLSNPSEEELKSLVKFITDNKVELILLQNFNFYSSRTDDLFLSLFGSTKHFIKPMKLLLKPLPNIPIYIHRINSLQSIEDEDLEYDDLNFISNSDSIEKDTPVIFSLRERHVFPKFNIQHPMISFLFNKDVTDKNTQQELKDQLSKKITSILQESINILKESNKPDLIKLAYNENSFEKFKDIFQLDPELFNKFDNLFQETWKSGISAKLIKETEIRPILSLDSFPWYWLT